MMKSVIATKVTGTVKWFNVKSGYGFICCDDTHKDVFVHRSAIISKSPKKVVKSIGDEESVEFDIVVGDKGEEASNVSGPNGGPVKGSPFAADRKRRQSKKKNKENKGEGVKVTRSHARSRNQNKGKDKSSNNNEDKLQELAEIIEKVDMIAMLKELLNPNHEEQSHSCGCDHSSEKDVEEDENVIKFKIVDKERKGGYGSIDEPSPYVSLSNVETSLEKMLDVDEMVVSEEKKSIKVAFDYPLQKKFVFEFESPNGGGFTRGQLATVIANKYKDIYKEEQETSTLPEESMSERSKRLGGAGCNLINRAQTDGKYGISGHVLGDLDLAQVIFSPKDDCYYLSVDS